MSAVFGCTIWPSAHCSVVDKQQPHPLHSIGGCAAPWRESRLWWPGVTEPRRPVTSSLHQEGGPEGYRLQVAAIL